MTEEGRIQNDIMRTFATHPKIRLFRANVGRGRFGRRVVQFGIPGQADLTGIVEPSGQRLEIEVKTPTGRLSKEQRAWGKMILRFNGIYIVARCVQDVREGLRRQGVILL